MTTPVSMLQLYHLEQRLQDTRQGILRRIDGLTEDLEKRGIQTNIVIEPDGATISVYVDLPSTLGSEAELPTKLQPENLEPTTKPPHGRTAPNEPLAAADCIAARAEIPNDAPAKAADASPSAPAASDVGSGDTKDAPQELVTGPLSEDEEAVIVGMSRDGANSYAIATALNRNPPGFHHAVKRVLADPKWSETEETQPAIGFDVPAEDGPIETPAIDAGMGGTDQLSKPANNFEAQVNVQINRIRALPASDWTRSEDAKLFTGLSSGLGIEEVAHNLEMSREECVARFKLLRGKTHTTHRIFLDQALRKLAEQEQ